MPPTLLNLFFVQEMLKPCDPRGWKKFLARQKAARQRAARSPEEKARRNKERYWSNPVVQRARTEAWRQENKEQVAETSRAWRDANPDKIRATEWRRNKPKKRAYMRAYNTNRRADDPEYKLLTNARTRINRALGADTNGIGTRELLGMEIPEYKIYLQGQFRPGMTWENHGSIWHIDHIRPCADFDLSDPAQQRECFNWSNTQPLFAEENLRKGDNVPR